VSLLITYSIISNDYLIVVDNRYIQEKNPHLYAVKKINSCSVFFLSFFFIIRVKYILAPCSLQTLFFVPSFLFVIKCGTCAMEKNANGTSINFFIQN
jgi:hypothetical protein